MKFKRYRAILVGIFISTFYLGQGQPAGYYDAAQGLTGENLQNALHGIIDNHTVKSYDYIWTAFQSTDVNANGKVWDMYSNCSFTFVSDQCGNYSDECDCYNREHSFPSSWFNEALPMYSDLFQLVPTDGKVNGMRGNYPFGETSSPTYTSGNGSKLGPCSYPGYAGIVFEPVDIYKGDFARNYFYMATRYSDLIAGWENNDNNANAVLDGTSYPAFESWFLDMLMEWHTNDPVSQKEIDRNNNVYAIQHNRNPFIDHLEYVELIWGEGLAPEPENHPAGFSAHTITLSWTDATGGVVPDGYLIRMSDVGFGSVLVPQDGITITDNFWNKNVSYGVETCIFTGLTPNTTYYFKIYGYTGSGTAIDYKTDGTIQQVSLQAN